MVLHLHSCPAPELKAKIDALEETKTILEHDFHNLRQAERKLMKALSEERLLISRYKAKFGEIESE